MATPIVGEPACITCRMERHIEPIVGDVDAGGRCDGLGHLFRVPCSSFGAAPPTAIAGIRSGHQEKKGAIRL
jgi:hypothetical protein